MTPSELFELARDARRHAYAPYSGYSVGAAIEAVDGRIAVGANVENVSFGATMCAERTALFHLISQGVREIRRVAVVTRDGGTPCGLCLQALVEFAPNPSGVEVHVYSEDGTGATFALNELIPHAFRTVLSGEPKAG